MTATIPIRDSGPMAIHLLADADQQNDSLRRSFRSRPVGQLWERESERDAAMPNRDEFEFPETDPAEADPAEADPAEAWPSVRIEIDGRTIVGQLSYLGVVIGTVETIDGPAMVTRDELYRWNAGMPAFLTCPLHGADCEAWA